MAEYKQPILQSICSYLSQTLRELSRAALADSKYSIPAISAVVDAFLKDHGLSDLTSEVLAYDLTSEDTESIST